MRAGCGFCPPRPLHALAACTSRWIQREVGLSRVMESSPSLALAFTRPGEPSASSIGAAADPMATTVVSPRGSACDRLGRLCGMSGGADPART